MADITITGDAPRDERGWAWHPAVPWDSLPEDTDLSPRFQAWGYELHWCLMQYELEEDEEPLRSYLDGEPNISAWVPQRPSGDGWLLLVLHDSEDGPVAVFARRTAPQDPTPPATGATEGAG